MTKELATKQETRIEALIKQDSVKARFNEVLGKKAPGFISSLISAVKSNDMLRDAEPMSVLSSAMVAASLDLPINPSLGFAHIVPYKTDGVAVAQFQMGWKGFVQLAVRSGQYHKLNPFIVYEGQLVKWDKFKDEMEFREEKVSDRVALYVLYFKLNSGFEKFFVMTYDEMEKHAKRYSQAYKKGFGPWKTDFDAMGLKTVTKLGLSKFGVLSIEMNKAVQVDEGVIDVQTEEPTYIDAVQEPKTEASETSSRLKEAINVQPTAEDGIVMDYKTAMDEAKTEEEIDRLFNESATKLKDTDNKALLFAHGKMRKKKL
jgi:recombination protein RecT